jgi:PAS domain S-box-containing protein
METISIDWRKYWPSVACIFACVVLYMTGLHNYLVIHILIELFCIAVGWGIFLVVWNTRHLIENSYFLVMGIAYLFIGFLDLFHVLSSNGMGFFPGNTINRSAQLWIAVRCMESLSFLFAAILLNRKIKTVSVFSAYCIGTFLLFLMIFYWKNFPECINSTNEATGFYKTGEYLILLIQFVSMLFFYPKRDRFEPSIFLWLFASIVFNMASELFYSHFYNRSHLFDLVGNGFNLTAFYCLYKPLIEVTLKKPYTVLFRELKQREDALRESEAATRSLINSPTDYMFLLDTDYRLISCNENIARIFRHSIDELVGKPVFEVFEPEISQKLRQWLEQVESRREFVRFTDEIQGRWIDNVIYPIRNSKGNIIRTAVIARDVTTMKRTEIELEKTRMAAETANKAKSEFLAGMNHEIRTPLNVIIGMTRFLLDSCLPQEQHEQARMIYLSSETLLSLINDILDFSKIEAGKLELEALDFDLEKTVRETIEMLTFKAEEKGLELIFQFQEDTPRWLCGDPNRLRQILINLINNAIKFTPEGRIVVFVCPESGDCSVIRFSVSDTGIGIPEEHLNRLFQSFSQADVSISRKYGGTGLGLAISKTLAELMGGRIGVESCRGKGTTFWFTICPERGKGPEPLHTGSQYPADECTDLLFPNPNQIRILLAEDNEMNQKLVLALLKKFGLWADTVCNGKEVIDILKKNQYDIVLMDVRMPEMDGLEATRQIRSLDSGVLNPHIPIVAMTADATLQDRDACMKSGMNAYISKPIHPQALFEVLKEQIGKKPAHILPSNNRLSEDGLCDGDCPIPIFDRKDLLARMCGDEDLVDSILTEVPQYIAETLKNLETAIETASVDSIVLHAHTLKGLAANVSAIRLREAALEMEHGVRKGKTETLRSLMLTLRQEWERLLPILKENP